MSQLEIDVQSVQRWMQAGVDDQGVGVALVDCRERNEHDVCHIQGAILLPMSSWPPPQASLDALNGKRVIVHCHHGGRSLRVASWFRQNGHPEAISMAGGIDLWSEKIDPTVPRY